MPRVTLPLNNTQIANAKPRLKEYNLSDGRGLNLRIKPNGTKSWLFQFSAPFTKKRTNISLGTYPEIALKKARERRDAYRALLAENIDPRDQRRHEALEKNKELSNTLCMVAEKWIPIKRTQVTADYATDIERSLSNHVFPTLGKVPIQNITAPQTIDCLKPLEKMGKLETIKRLCQNLNQIMDFAVNTGLLESNRLSGIKAAFQAPKRKHMASLHPEELPELVNAIASANIRATTRELILWQLHTMTRPAEAAGTTWEEIDLKNKLWTIPAARMKKGRPHKIPLTQGSLIILKTMQPISGHRMHVFPADRNPRQATNSQNTNMALKRMGFENRLVAHGLRSLASTTLNEQRFDAELIEVALAHVDKNQVRDAYNRAEYLDERREMMEWWSERILSESRPSAKLVAD